MRKDHLITNLIGISFFSFIAALVLAIVFAAIRGIIGVVVPETATVMVVFFSTSLGRLLWSCS